MIRGTGWPVSTIWRSFLRKAATSSGEDVRVRLAEQGGFVLAPATLGEGEVGHGETTLEVLGEEHDAGQVVEDRAQAAHLELAKPSLVGPGRFHTTIIPPP